MKGRLLNLLTIPSLLLCVAACALWVRSHFRSDLAFWTSGDLQWSVRLVTGAGGIGLVVDRDVKSSEVSRPGCHWFVSPVGGYARGGWRTRGGFAATFGTLTIALALPFWMLFVLAAVAPALRLVRRLRVSRRHSRSLCLACGYDLRATPGRCPECGTEAAEATERSPPAASRTR